MKVHENKILLIESSVSQLLHLKEALVQDGYIIEIATTGTSALTKIKRNSYDIFILSVMLTDMSGFNFLNIYNHLGIKKESQIIMTFDKDNPNSIKSALEMGAVDYIVKPINMDILRAKIKNLFSFQRYMKRSL
jgi:PleD family two-component response regulator